ncbi:hypothetical protein ACB098_03G123600 [Castanea mollissima]
MSKGNKAMRACVRAALVPIQCESLTHPDRKVFDKMILRSLRSCTNICFLHGRKLMSENPHHLDSHCVRRFSSHYLQATEILYCLGCFYPFWLSSSCFPQLPSSYHLH